MCHQPRIFNNSSSHSTTTIGHLLYTRYSAHSTWWCFQNLFQTTLPVTHGLSETHVGLRKSTFWKPNPAFSYSRYFICFIVPPLILFSWRYQATDLTEGVVGLYTFEPY